MRIFERQPVPDSILEHHAADIARTRWNRFDDVQKSISLVRNDTPLLERGESKKLVEEMRGPRGYTEVPSTLQEGLVEDVIATFTQFCELDQSEKEAFSIPGENGRGKGAHGYIVRLPENDTIETNLGKVPEHKEYFHYHPKNKAAFLERISSLSAEKQTIVRTLIEKLDTLWKETVALARITVKQMEAEGYPGLYARIFPEGQEPRFTLRVLMYKKVEQGAFHANHHFDAGTLTFSIKESGSGLGGAPGKVDANGDVQLDREMEPISRNGNTIIVWAGGNFRKQIDPEMKGFWHGVEQTDATDDVALGNDARWAVVGFLDIPGENVMSLEETHGKK